MFVHMFCLSPPVHAFNLPASSKPLLASSVHSHPFSLCPLTTLIQFLSKQVPNMGEKLLGAKSAPKILVGEDIFRAILSLKENILNKILDIFCVAVRTNNNSVILDNFDQKNLFMGPNYVESAFVFDTTIINHKQTEI